MSIPPYVQGYPPDGSSLGQTKSTMRDNLDGTFLTVGVDHINNNGQPGSNPAGYHNVIHIVPQGSNPGSVSGYGQLYSKTVNSYTTDQTLFWETGSGLIQQLTANFNPVAMTNGCTFLPGGIILQWGFQPQSSGNPVSYKITFPNNVFTVLVSIKGSSANRSIIIGDSPGPSLSQFQYVLTNTTNVDGIYWMAIGN